MNLDDAQLTFYSATSQAAANITDFAIIHGDGFLLEIRIIGGDVISLDGSRSQETLSGFEKTPKGSDAPTKYKLGFIATLGVDISVHVCKYVSM